MQGVRAGLTDTVLGTHPFTLRVVDRFGDAAPGVRIVLQTSPTIDSSAPPIVQYRVFVAPLGTTAFSLVLTDTTGRTGTIAVQTRLGFNAGPADLLVSAPELGFLDTVGFTVKPVDAHGPQRGAVAY